MSDLLNTLVGVDDANASGDLDITSNIVINGAGSGTTIIQANAAAGVAVERVIHFPAANVTAVFNGVTIRNGRQATTTFGGGVRINGAGDSVTFNNSIIRDNFSGFGGGGLVITGAATASITLNNTTVTNNQATGSGGGIFLNSGGTLIATNSTISNNTASSAGGNALGGGIHNASGTITLTNTTVSNNFATTTGATNAFGGGILTSGTSIANISGGSVSNNTANSTGGGAGFAGGIYNEQSTLTITNSSVRGNTASSFHAGIRTLAFAPATTTINRSAVVNDTSPGEGAGVVNFSAGASDSITNINNSTVGGNMSGGSGGGVENVNTSTGAATVNINFSTIAGNMANTDNTGADVGGGLANIGGGTGASVIQVTNSIVADNTIGTGGTGPDISGTITSANYNHVENTAGGTFVPMANDVTGTDPQLTPLALNGGTTLNYLPAATSPVLDTIPSGTNGCGTTFNVDQRNVIRPTDSDNNAVAACEKGSVEVVAPTAAMASVSGRVLSGFDSRRGVANATITMTDAAGVTRFARTNAFGYFRLEDVATGQTYLFDVSAKRYQFQTQVVNVNNELTDLNFTPLYYKPVSK